MIAIGAPIRKMDFDSSSILGSKPRIEDMMIAEKATRRSIAVNLNVNKEYIALYSSITMEALSLSVSGMSKCFLPNVRLCQRANRVAGPDRFGFNL